MIGMLVRDDNRRQIFRLLSDGGHSLEDFFTAETGVNQNARSLSPDECRVSGTAAGQYANLKDDAPPKTVPSVLPHFLT